MNTQVTTLASRSGTVATSAGQGGVSAPQVAQGQGLSFVKPTAEEIGARELVWGLVVMSLWFCFFVIGIIVPAMTLLGAVWSGNLGFGTTIGYSLVAVAAYALTNPLFLMCTAAMLGCMAHRWQVSDQLGEVASRTPGVQATRTYLAAGLRGFFTYLMFVAGFLVVSTQNALENITYDQYVRIAGMVSILGFVVGYDPNLLVRFIRKIVESMPGSIPDTSDSAAAPGTSVAGAPIPTTLSEAERKATRAEQESEEDE